MLAFFLVFGIAITGILRNTSALPGLVRLQQVKATVQSVLSAPKTFNVTLPAAPVRMFTTPPQQPPSFKIQAASISPAIKDIIAKSKKTNDRVGSDQSNTFDSVVAALAHDETQLASASRYTLLKDVSPDKSIRDAATEASQMLSDYGIEALMRPDVYKAVKAVYDAKPILEAEDERLLVKMELGYRRSGLLLSSQQQQQIKDLQQKMTNVSIAFSQNLGEENGGIWFSKDELDGVSSDLVDNWETKERDGVKQYKMTYKYPDIFPTLKYANVESTRRKAWVGYESKAPQNTELMVEMLALRREVSKLLGYRTFADYAIEEKMAKTGTTVMTFLNDLAEQLRPAGKKDLETLVAIKRQQGSELPFKGWDHSWATRILVEQEYDVDAEKVAEYFEMDNTVREMLGLYETLFSLKFNEVSVSEEDYETWHEDVRQFAVWRTDTSTFAGWLYFDMFPREGKFGHAAEFVIQPGGIDQEGDRQYPVVALVCNFSRSTKQKPSLLKHDEVVTFFHELGHAIHDLVSQVKWSRFHGTSVVPVSMITVVYFSFCSSVQDFVEAPSQMLENWCFKKNILSTISKHYKTGESLPDELIQRMQKAKDVNQGLSYLRQLHFALFDMKVHTDYAGTNTSQLTNFWNSLRTQVAFLDPSPENPPGEASFAHIMGGYEAGYYGYLWSKIYSSDMFATKFEGHELDPAVGAQYRDLVLGPGGSRDAMDTLIEFLGRAPNNAAFLKELGLN